MIRRIDRESFIGPQKDAINSDRLKSYRVRGRAGTRDRRIAPIKYLFMHATGARRGPPPDIGA